MADTPHVIVLGVGFGGIGALKKLRDADIRITLIDKHDYHTFQPLLYQVATEELTPEQIGVPIRDVLHHHQNVTFHQASRRRRASDPRPDPARPVHAHRRINTHRSWA